MFFVLTSSHSDIDDCTREWSIPEDDYDYVHFRYLSSCIPDWYAFFCQAYRVTAPDCYLGSYEGPPNVRSDGDTLPADTSMAQ